MKRLALLLLCCLGLIGPAAAQHKERTTVRVERKEDYSTVFFADKTYPGTQTILLKFGNLENCSNASSTERIELKQSGPFLTLRSADGRSHVRFSYSYRIFDHAVNPRVDRDFLYRLPFSASRSARVRRTVSDTRLLRSDAPAEFHGYSFGLAQGDTVYAARKGLVVSIEQPGNSEKRAELIYTRDQSSILIEHADGTIGRYGSVEEIRVKPGDTVYPFTPLGLASSFNGERYFLVFQLLYRTEDAENENKPFPYVYLAPRFATTSGDEELTIGDSYVPRVDEALLTREMNKRERKKFGFGK